MTFPLEGSSYDGCRNVFTYLYALTKHVCRINMDDERNNNPSVDSNSEESMVSGVGYPVDSKPLVCRNHTRDNDST